MQSLRRGRKDQITSAYLPSILKCCGTLKFLSCIKKAGIREMKENSLNPKRQPDNNSHGLQRKHCLDVWSEVISQRNEEQIHSCAAELKHGKTRDVYKSMLSLSGVAVLWRVKHWTTVSFFSCDCISDNKMNVFVVRWQPLLIIYWLHLWTITLFQRNYLSLPTGGALSLVQDAFKYRMSANIVNTEHFIETFGVFGFLFIYAYWVCYCMLFAAFLLSFNLHLLLVVPFGEDILCSQVVLIHLNF